MPSFLKREADIVRLAHDLATGLAAHTEAFPSPPVAPEELNQALAAYNAAREVAILASAQSAQGTAADEPTQQRALATRAFWGHLASRVPRRLAIFHSPPPSNARPQLIKRNPGTESHMSTTCAHLDQVQNVSPHTPDGCEECLATGGVWVHLRLCLKCGHVGCCDNSPGKHATKHFHQTQHPVIRSFEPDEDWGWCYLDQLFMEPAPRAR